LRENANCREFADDRPRSEQPPLPGLPRARRSFVHRLHSVSGCMRRPDAVPLRGRCCFLHSLPSVSGCVRRSDAVPLRGREQSRRPSVRQHRLNESPLREAVASATGIGYCNFIHEYFFIYNTTSYIAEARTLPSQRRQAFVRALNAFRRALCPTRRSDHSSGRMYIVPYTSRCQGLDFFHCRSRDRNTIMRFGD
jgi:hypothetical protein